MAGSLKQRLARFEERRGRPGDYLKVIIQRFSETPPADPSPKWNDTTRVLVVHEGYENLGDELMRSLGEAA